MVPVAVPRRYEIDKLTASQRLDLNLEKGRMRDELQMLRDKTNELEIKVGWGENIPGERVEYSWRGMHAGEGAVCACLCGRGGGCRLTEEAPN